MVYKKHIEAIFNYIKISVQKIRYSKKTRNIYSNLINNIINSNNKYVVKIISFNEFRYCKIELQLHYNLESHKLDITPVHN